MIKDLLKEKEAIAYLSLKNDLNSGHIAHSYLFYGDLNPFKKDVAFLLAQSIVEGENDFACETCNTCRRIKDNLYFDVIYIDGYKGSIKKEDIENIMSQFSRTSLESSGKKVYIIDNINNISAKGINMLLKFMEEPSNDHTYGIFISDNIDTLLETIISRCEKVPFVTKDFSYLIKEYEKQGFDYIDAYLLSDIKHELVSIDVNDEAYLNGKEYVYKTIDSLNNRDYIPVLFSREFYSCVSKENFKQCSDYYLSIMLKMIHDALNDVRVDDDEYNGYLNILKDSDLNKLLDVFLRAKDKTNYAINRNLLFDQIAFEIIS